MSTLDEILKQNEEWLGQARKQRLFEDVDRDSIRFAEQQHERRMKELKLRIEGLERRKEEAVASYDRAIALEQAELKILEAQPSPAVPPESMRTRPAKPERAKRKQK